jgi:hypothetical protein
MHFFSQIRQLTTRWTLLSFSPPHPTHIARVLFNFCYNILKKLPNNSIENLLLVSNRQMVIEKLQEFIAIYKRSQ